MEESSKEKAVSVLFLAEIMKERRQDKREKIMRNAKRSQRQNKITLQRNDKRKINKKDRATYEPSLESILHMILASTICNTGILGSQLHDRRELIFSGHAVRFRARNDEIMQG